MKQSYDFPVAFQGIQTDKGIKLPKRLAVVRTDTKQALGIVSDKYSHLPHSEVVDGFREALKGQKFEEKISLGKNGARLFYTATFKSVSVEVKKGDIVGMQITAQNSYDGSKTLQFTFGGLRLVCLNGMVMGDKTVRHSFRHIGQLGLKVSVIQQQFAVMAEAFKKTLPTMKEMTTTKLVPSPAEFFDPKILRIPAYVAAIAKKEFEDSKGKTVWDAYNATTHAITHKLRKENPRAQLSYGKRAWEAASAQL